MIFDFAPDRFTDIPITNYTIQLISYMFSFIQYIKFWKNRNIYYNITISDKNIPKKFLKRNKSYYNYIFEKNNKFYVNIPKAFRTRDMIIPAIKANYKYIKYIIKDFELTMEECINIVNTDYRCVQYLVFPSTGDYEKIFYNLVIKNPDIIRYIYGRIGIKNVNSYPSVYLIYPKDYFYAYNTQIKKIVDIDLKFKKNNIICVKLADFCVFSKFYKKKYIGELNILKGSRILSLYEYNNRYFDYRLLKDIYGYLKI